MIYKISVITCYLIISYRHSVYFSPNSSYVGLMPIRVNRQSGQQQVQPLSLFSHNMGQSWDNFVKCHCSLFRIIKLLCAYALPFFSKTIIRKRNKLFFFSKQNKKPKTKKKMIQKNFMNISQYFEI